MKWKIIFPKIMKKNKNECNSYKKNELNSENYFFGEKVRIFFELIFLVE
jgi:hypothetical protein